MFFEARLVASLRIADKPEHGLGKQCGVTGGRYGRLRSPTSGHCREVHANNFKVRREDLLRSVCSRGLQPRRLIDFLPLRNLR